MICNKAARDVDSEDASTITKVIAEKNFAPHTRVLVQVLQDTNKAYLSSIPAWTKRDDAVCLVGGRASHSVDCRPN